MQKNQDNSSKSTTLSEIRGEFDLSKLEKRIILSVSGRIRTKYRPFLMERLIKDEFLDKKGELTEKGIRALNSILDPVSVPFTMNDRGKEMMFASERSMSMIEQMVRDLKDAEPLQFSSPPVERIAGDNCEAFEEIVISCSVPASLFKAKF